MPRAVLEIHVPEDVWIGALTRQHPDVVFRILAAFPDEENGVALAEIEGPNLQSVLAEMEDTAEVIDLELVGKPEGSVLVQFETSDPFLLLPVRDSGALLDLPFLVANGRASWEVTATSDRLSRLGDQLRTLNVEFDVHSVTQLVETNRLLTEKQAELVQTAVDEGYYDTPRDCSLTDLADAVGIAKSTASEMLHRAEEKIIKEFVDDGGLTDDSRLTGSMD